MDGFQSGAFYHVINVLFDFELAGEQPIGFSTELREQEQLGGVWLFVPKPWLSRNPFGPLTGHHNGFKLNSAHKLLVVWQSYYYCSWNSQVADFMRWCCCVLPTSTSAASLEYMKWAFPFTMQKIRQQWKCLCFGFLTCVGRNSFSRWNEPEWKTQ